MKQGEVARMFELDWMACSGGAELGRLDGDFIVQTAKGDLDVLRKLVPQELDATEDVIIYTARFKETIDEEGEVRWPWPFNEWGIGIRCKLKAAPHTEGNFLVQLYVDDDLVLVHGREVWGYPKKIGQTVISDTSDAASRKEYTVARRGSHLVAGHVDDLSPIPAEEFPFSGTGYNILFRQVPAVDRVGIEKMEIIYVKLDLDASETMASTDSAISIQDGTYDQIPVGPLRDVKGYFGRVSMYHHGVAPLVVETRDRARPLDYSKVGKSVQPA